MGQKSLPLSFEVLFSLLLPQFLSQSLVAIDDDSWQEQLIRVILERIRYFTDDSDEKVCLGVVVARGEVQGGGWCGRNLGLIQVATEICMSAGLVERTKQCSCVLRIKGCRGLQIGGHTDMTEISKGLTFA